MTSTSHPLSDLAPNHPILGSEEEWESIEPPMDSDLHRIQIELLLACLAWWWRPDFFVVKGVDPRPRKSWMVWREDDRYPDLIIEFLSSGTAGRDRREKKQIYQDQFQTPEYFWFHPFTQEFKGFRLERGEYQPIAKTTNDWLWSEQLELYLGIYNQKLRFFAQEGELVLSPSERAEQEYQRAEQERQRAEQEYQRAEQERQQLNQERQGRQQAEQEIERLRKRLQELGIKDP